MRPSSSKPTSQPYRKAWRLPVRIMSSSRSTRNLTACAGAPGEDRREAGELRHLRFLAAEAAAHAPALDDDVVRRHPQRVRDHLLDLARVLRRAPDAHAAVFGRHGQRDLALEVEVVLTAARGGAPQPVRRARDRGGRVAANEVRRRQHVRLGGQRLVDGQHRGQRLEVEAGEPRRGARGVGGRRGDGEHRLAGEQHDAVGEDRVVVLDRADVVDAGDVGGGDDGDDARRGADRGEVDRTDARVRQRALADRRVQRAAPARAGRRCRWPRRRRAAAPTRARRRRRRCAGRGDGRVRGVHRDDPVRRSLRTRGSARAARPPPSRASSAAAARRACRGGTRLPPACR